MLDSFDLLLTGGTVINPATNTNQKLDVGITDDRITAIAAGLQRGDAKMVIDF